MTKCKICGKNGFKKQQGLSQHMRQVHPDGGEDNDEKASQCELETKWLTEQYNDFKLFIINLFNSMAETNTTTISEVQSEMNNMKLLLNDLLDNKEKTADQPSIPLHSPAPPPLNIPTPSHAVSKCTGSGNMNSQPRENHCVNLANRFAPLQVEHTKSWGFDVINSTPRPPTISQPAIVPGIQSYSNALTSNVKQYSGPLQQPQQNQHINNNLHQIQPMQRHPTKQLVAVPAHQPTSSQFSANQPNAVQPLTAPPLHQNADANIHASGQQPHITQVADTHQMLNVPTQVPPQQPPTAAHLQQQPVCNTSAPSNQPYFHAPAPQQPLQRYNSHQYQQYHQYHQQQPPTQALPQYPPIATHLQQQTAANTSAPSLQPHSTHASVSLQPQQRATQRQQSGATTRRIGLLGDSHFNGIFPGQFAKRLNHSAHIMKFNYNGATAPHLAVYSDVLLANKPTDILIHVGCNDVWGRNIRNVSSQEIANDIIQLAIKCRQHGVQKIYISSLLITRVASSNIQVHEVNTLLKSMCELNNFQYIDNSFLTDHYLDDDVHLSNHGKRLFVDNYLSVLQ